MQFMKRVWIFRDVIFSILIYEDNFFDMVYCISVLEHTENYENVIEEFHRVIKPGGLLLLTFDIDLSGKRDLSPEKSIRLLEMLELCFARVLPDSDCRKMLENISEREDILTTAYIRQMKKELLPVWRFRKRDLIRNFLRFNFELTPFWNLTVFGGVWRKADSH